MESEGSLPYSQEPATGPYPESNPVHNLIPYFFKTCFNIILLSSSLSPKWSLIPCLPTKMLYAF